MEADDGIVVGPAELVLCTVLCTDGGWPGRVLCRTRRLPGRALVLGMP